MSTQNRIKFISGCLKHVVCTRNQNEEDEAYRKGVLETYNEIKEMYDVIVKENIQPTIEQMEMAFNNLMIVFKTKKVSEEEQMTRIESLLDDTGTRELIKNSLTKINK